MTTPLTGGARILAVADRVLFLATLGALTISGLAIGVLAVLGTADILGVSLFERSIPSAIEVLEAMAAIAISGAMAAVQYERANIEVDLFIAHFSPATRRVSDGMAGLCGFIVFGVMCSEATRLALRSVHALELNHGLIAFPIYPFKIIVAVGFGIAALQFLRLLFSALTGQPVSKPYNLFPHLSVNPGKEH